MRWAWPCRAGDETGAGRLERQPQVVENRAPVFHVLERLSAERHVERAAQRTRRKPCHRIGDDVDVWPWPRIEHAVIGVAGEQRPRRAVDVESAEIEYAAGAHQPRPDLPFEPAPGLRMHLASLTSSGAVDAAD